MARKLHNVSFLILFVSLIVSVRAQDNPCHLTLSGQVLDTESREELPGATVFLKDLNIGVTAELDGTFRVDNLCPGVCAIEIRFIGYLTREMNIEVSHYKEVEILMESVPIGLDDVVIEGHREEILNAQPVVSLGITELDQSAGQNLGSTLGTISGVSTLQTGSTISKPVIHGMHSSRILLLLNGIRHEGQQWGVEHAPEIDPFMASEITVIKGAAAVQYGPDAIGGVVLISPPKLPESPDIHSFLHLVGESNGRSGTISGRIEGGIEGFTGFGWRVQGTLKKAGNLKAPDYYLSNTGLEEGDYSAAIGYSNEKWGTEVFYSSFNSSVGILSASHLGNKTDLEIALEQGDPYDKETATFSYSIDRPFQQIHHDMLTFKSFIRFSEDLQMHASYGYQVNRREEYDRVRGSITGPQLDFKLLTHSIDLHLDHIQGDAFNGSVGVNAEQQSNVYQGRQLIPNFRSYNIGIYGIEHFVRKYYELELGIRYDYKFVESFRNISGEVIREEFKFTNFSTVLGGIWQLNRDLGLRANLSTAWRPPNINEQFSDGVHQGVASWELGNAGLDSEKAFNISLSANLDKSKVHGEITAYYHYINGFIYLEPQYPETKLTIRGAFPLFEYKQVDARFAGADLDLFVDLINRLSWRIKGALVRARNLTDDEDLIWIPSDRLENNFTYTLDQAKGLNPYFGLGIVAVREQTHYPEGVDFADPPDGFVLLNLNFGSKLKLGNQKMSVNFEIKNLLNTRYREYMNRFRYFADEPGINFILRLNYNF